MKKLLACFMCAVMLLTCLAGCSSDSDGSSDSSGVKRIVYANGSQPDSLEYVDGSRFLKYSTIKYNIFTGLTRVGEDGTIEMGWADEYTVSDDGLVWTFHIRDDAKFSDGTDMDATDWEETMKWYCAPETMAQATSLQEYVLNMTEYLAGECEWEDVGYKAIDEQTLEITLKNTCAYFLDVASTYMALPMHIINENEDWTKTAETYVGNGPFRMVELNDQVNLVMEKNPYYYDADSVNIDEVEIVFLDEPAVELAAYQNGEIDISDDPNAEALATYADSDELVVVEKIGVNYLTVNTEAITDKLVRQALAYAIDRETLVSVLGSVNLPATGWVPYGLHWAEEQYRDVAGAMLGYDSDRAAELLEEAGYPGGEGLPVYTYICQNTEEALNIAQALQSMWSEVGIQVEIVSYESSTYWDVFDTDDWDIGHTGWTGDFDDPTTILFLWEQNEQVDTDGTLMDARWTGEAAEEFDALMQTNYVITDSETRMENFVAAEEILAEEFPSIPLMFYTDAMLVNPRVQGIVKNYQGHVYFQYADIVE